MIKTIKKTPVLTQKKLHLTINNHPKRQAGFGMMSLATLLIVGGFIIMTGLKLMPTYLQHEEIKQIIDEVASSADPHRPSKRQIHTSIERHLQINNIDSTITAKDFRIRRPNKNSRQQTLSINYERRSPWIANIDFLTSFQYEKPLGQTY